MTEILIAIWSSGYLLSIYPIYRALGESHLENLIKEHESYYSSSNDKKGLKRGDIANNAAYASVISLGWFLAIPFYASYFFHKKGKPQLAKEAETITEDYKEVRKLKAALSQARAQIEAHSDEVIKDDTPTLPRGPLPPGYTRRYRE